MKKTTAFITCLFLGALILNAQDLCNPYFKLSKGTQWTMSMKHNVDTEGMNKFIKKFYEAEHKRAFKVKKIESVGSYSEIYIEVSSYDYKGKTITDKDMIIAICKNGEFYMDVYNYGLQPPELPFNMTKKDLKSMTLEGLVTPGELKESTLLNTASSTVETKNALLQMGGKNLTTYQVKDRKIIGKETIETPLGKLECVKIQYTNHRIYEESSLMAQMIGKSQVSWTVVEYIAKDYGMVKRTYTDETGKVVGTYYMSEFEM